MEDIKEGLKAIFRKERGLIVLMILTFLFAAFLFVFALIKIDPSGAVTKIGYGDIGGYRDGAWTNMLTFPVLAILFGFLHNLLAVKIFNKRGAGMAKVFLFVTMMLIFGSVLVLIRLSKGI